MNDFLNESAYFAVLLSLAAYEIGIAVKKKLRLDIFNPLLLAIIITIIFLMMLKIDYSAYRERAEPLSRLLTPAVVSLAVFVYKQIDALKQNLAAISLGIISGVLTSLIFVFLTAKLFGLNHSEFVTFLPNSITTAIGIEVAEELGGYAPIAAAAIIVTGIVGSIGAPLILRIFKITDSTARGTAIGCSSHAVGTAKAMEIGEAEGAASSLSIVISGIVTVIGADIFAGLI